MKKYFAIFFLLNIALFAEPCCCPPCLLSGLYIDAKPASFESESLAGEHLQYAEANLSYTYNYPICDTTGLSFGAGYTSNWVIWKQNPYFNETQFNYVDFLLGGYTKAIPSFLWSLVGFAYIDTAVLDLANYALYQVILHGKYYVNDCFTFNSGFILELGLDQDMIWPILGIDWNITPKWRLGLVYPLDLALEYKIDPSLSASANARILRTRHRVESYEIKPNAIFEYTNWGMEGELIWRPLISLCIKGFAGSTTGGDFKVANQYGHHAKHRKLNAAPYGGISGNWYF